MMYTILDSRKITELNVVRHGWLSPEYELTDDASSYGKMRYSGISKRKPVVEAANDRWSFIFEGFFSRNILILDKAGVQIGKLTRDLFSTINILTMESGFTAKLHRVAFFSRQSVWESDEYGTILHINNPFFSSKYPISIAQNPAPQTLIPLLIFLGVHRIIVDQQKRRTSH